MPCLHRSSSPIGGQVTARRNTTIIRAQLAIIVISWTGSSPEVCNDEYIADSVTLIRHWEANMHTQTLMSATIFPSLHHFTVSQEAQADNTCALTR